MRFEFGGLSLATEHAVNDVKKFTIGGKDWYVMALHKKGDVGLTAKDTEKLWYSLSKDGKRFADEQRMPGAARGDDRFIFAVGFVARKDRILGVLYGAGGSERCDRNRIFGHWLQKRVLLTAIPDYYRGQRSRDRGPRRPRTGPSVVQAPTRAAFQGTLTVFAEDGLTPLGVLPVSLRPGAVYRLERK